MNHELRRGIELFNCRRFFDAHEALEDAWRLSQGAERRLLQALVQIAVGFHHYSRGNLTGARSVLGRGLAGLQESSAANAGIDAADLREQVGVWLEALATGGQPGQPPKIRASKEDEGRFS